MRIGEPAALSAPCGCEGGLGPLESEQASKGGEEDYAHVLDLFPIGEKVSYDWTRRDVSELEKSSTCSDIVLKNVRDKHRVCLFSFFL